MDTSFGALSGCVAHTAGSLYGQFKQQPEKGYFGSPKIDAANSHVPDYCKQSQTWPFAGCLTVQPGSLTPFSPNFPKSYGENEYPQ